MTDATLSVFGASAVPRAILAAFFARPGVVAHPRELARQLHRPPQVVGRKLRRLEVVGILASETVGRTRCYRVNNTSPIAAEIRSLVAKEDRYRGLPVAGASQRAGRGGSGPYGSYARGTERPTSDLDVLVAGSVDRAGLSHSLECSKVCVATSTQRAT